MNDDLMALRPEPNIPELKQVGKPLPRTDAPGKAFGRTLFAGDLVMPGMLHCKVLRSTRASARVRTIDVARAKALAGVRCVMTADDLAGRMLTTDIPGQTGERSFNTVQPILAKEQVRFYGEPIGLIAAETAEIAERAVELIEVDYEPLPAVFDPFEALKPGAPVIQGTDNIISKYRIRAGDVEKGFAAADLVVENTFSTHFQEHAFLETEAGIAWLDENEVVNLRMSTQVVEHFRAVAEALDLPHNRIRIQAMPTGGGFGGKENLTIEIFLALLALATRAPVRLTYTREESFLSHGKRHPFTILHRTGVTRDGAITAWSVDITADSGAYPQLSPYVLLYATIAATGPYRVENVAIDSRAVATNHLGTDAFRGFGTAQACFAHEGQMDEIAKVLGMDPMEFRRRHFIRTGDTNPTGQTIETAAWSEECMDRAWAALGERPPDDGPVRIGRGVACYQQSYGRISWFHDTSEAWVGIEMDGTVVVRSAVPDIGSGQVSAVCQIAAEVLGVTMDEVVTYAGDTAVNPLAGTSTASRQLYMSGNVVKLAATTLRDRLAGVAARHFDVEPDKIVMADSMVSVEGDAERSMPLKELVAICATAGVHRSELAIYRAPFSDRGDPTDITGRVFPDFTYGAQAVEVAVDTETGEVTVLKNIGAHDIGQAINPAAVAGQIEGGTVMGQGYALTENYLYDEGRPITPSFSEYLVPTPEDITEVTAIILESHSGLGPFGAKGIGEPSFAPVAPAIANAVADALGTRIFSLPISAEKVVNALGVRPRTG
jgi:CO/xanthine dehydrogenase Mo-binding subunit